MKYILLSGVCICLLASALLPVSTQARYIEDEHGCETWEGEKWDPQFGKCMDPDDYHDDDIRVYNWARDNGLTTATTFALFRDESHITRDEVAVIVERALNNKLFSAVTSTPAQVTFLDEKNISKEFKAAATFVQNAGIMRGNNGYFYPKNFLTEYEALVIVARATAQTEIKNVSDAITFARKIRDDFDRDDVNDRISRGDFFELMKKAKENQ